MKQLKLLICALLFQLSIMTANAGTFPSPELVKDQFVYTVPANFDPPLIGRHGLAEIQKSAEKLHYPYYVVIIDDLPVKSDEDPEEAAAHAIDGLAAEWQSTSDNFDVGKSSIFLLSYNPRQYRFLAGATWKSRLGFERDAHAPYTALFDRAVQCTPKDPKTGIIDMMVAVDNYLFDQTDPVRIEARRKAAEKAEQVRKLQEAHDRLDEELSRLEQLLNKPKVYLPADTKTYISALNKARDVRLHGSRDEVLYETDSLKKTNYVLERQINKRIDEEAKRRLQHNTKVASSLLISLLLLGIAFARWRQYRRLKKSFFTIADTWDQKLLNAKAKYANFYGNERSGIIGLSKMTGETKQLYDKVTAEVDAIYLGVEAMVTHIAKCRMTADRGSYLNISPLKHALADIENEFEFDTGKLDPGSLFGSLTSVIKVKPSEFSEDLDNRFSTIIGEWEYLKKAVEVRLRSAENLFPHQKLDEMLKTASDNGIPHVWFKDHPLFGSDESDQAVYGSVNSIRSQDPVAFIRQLDCYIAVEHDLDDCLSRLVKAIRTVNESRLSEAPQIGTTVLSPEDDPRLMFETARQQDDMFTGLIAGRNGEYNIESVESQAEQVQKMYQSAASQAVLVNNVINTVADSITQLRNDLQDIDSLAKDAEIRLTKAQGMHSNVHNPETSLNHGKQLLSAGMQSLESAQSNLTQLRHMDADRKLSQAKDQLRQAVEKFKLSIAQCDELDRQKAMYADKLEELESKRRKAESQIMRYGSRKILQGVPRYDISEPADYLALLIILEGLEQNWDAEVREAQREYEIEQERIRRIQEEEDRRDNSRFGSSGGGSWGGGGGSSSSGGSWGGGGRSSSSGGSW
ncbi:MAG: zinc ribbon domain-containing protein [Armatimonadota bacterium]